MKVREGNLLRSNNNGFTLIELLVVVGIIGILTGLVTVNLQGARERARDAQRKGNLDQIQKALELYKNDRDPQQYPDDSTWKVDLVNGQYMKQVPTDPTHDQVETWPDYTYQASIATDPLEYTLIACLENPGDSTTDENQGGTNNAVCTSGHSYTLTNP